MHRNQMTRRRRLARRVNAATEVERPIVCRGCAYPYLVHPTITAACTPSLQAIATMLGEEQHPIDGEILDAVRTFVGDGASPFFGRDVTVARHAAVHLRDLALAGHQQPTASPQPHAAGTLSFSRQSSLAHTTNRLVPRPESGRGNEREAVPPGSSKRVADGREELPV
jgi:hypothetical protein